jgi:DNA-binding transcriptional LysR family regulator
MTLQQLIYFNAIARLKSYTQAANELFVSQPNLSHAISKLEEELGTPLFIKKGRSIELSPAAEIFQIHVISIMKEIELAKSNISRYLNANKDEIRVTVSHTLEHSFIPPLIREFHGLPENQNISISFLPMESTTTAMEQLEAGEVDLGFGARIPRNDYEFFEVIKEALVALVPNIHPWASRSNITLAELCTEPFVTYDRRCGSRRDLDRLFQSHNLKPSTIIEANNERMITGIVAAGMGVSIVPLISEIKLFPVSPVCLEDHSIYRTLYMFWKKDIPLSPAAERFKTYIIRKMSKPGVP